MKPKKKVSIVIPTKNSARTLDALLKSIKKQSYKKTEIIVVDNNSKDETKNIASKYTKNVFNKGPERSAQRNFGANKAKGEYLLFLDSDMELTPKVIKECVEKINNLGGLKIPELSFGEGFWAKCKTLERSFYERTDVEAARFYPRKIFVEFHGFDEKLTGPEDWDLSKRVEEKYKIGRINAKIGHNEGKLSLIYTLKKKYYYAKTISKYMDKNNISINSSQISPLSRFRMFFSDPIRLFNNPIIGVGMLFMKTSEYAVAALGYVRAIK